MRIQHNIMAMNAYRNYSNNTSALSKNLEKLSSGYKINRAGDDAAGLAISEKMRAQITGLEAAQKNVKDGISLVNTAEGAMQEIQDMLNRMVYLATESANGTYDDPVDRMNLQKEVDSLKTEINRIAESANFNGIKLLDGSQADTLVGEAGIKTITAEMAKGIDIVNGTNGGGTKGEYSIDITQAFGDGDTIKFAFGSGDSVANPAPADITLTHDGAGGVGKFKGVTAEDQAKSIAEALSSNTDVAKNFTVTAEGSTVKLVNKNEGNKEATVTTVTPTNKNASLTAKAAATTTPGTSATAGDFDFTNLLDGATNGGMELAPGQTLNFEFTLGSGKKMTVDLEVTADMISGTDTKTTAINIVNALKNKAFNDDPDTVADESKIKLSEVFDITANGTKVGDIKFDLAGAAKAFDFTSAKVTNTDTGNSVTKAVANAAAGDAQVYELGLGAAPAAQNLAYGDKLTIEGALSDGRTFSLEMVAGEDFEIGANKAATFENLQKELQVKGVDIKLNDGKTVKSTDIFGADKDVDMSTAGVFTSVANGEVGKTAGGITEIKLENAPDAAVDQNLAAGSPQTSAASTLTFSDGLNYGSTVTVDGRTYEIVKSAEDVSSGRNIAVVAADANDSAAVAKAFADAYNNTNGAGADYTAVASGDKVTIKSKAVGSAQTAVNIQTAGDTETRLEFTLDPAKVQSGSTVTINGNKYQFVKKGEADTVGSDAKAVEVEFNGASAKSLADALANVADGKVNAKITVGADGLVTVKGIADKEGTVSVPTVTFANGKGTGLQLQIGDTSDAFNQLKVGIGAMKTGNLGIDGINIGTQAGAQAAVDVIKNAINYVSSVRGDLGAISNRLDHTANNLSVMRENIQDAESAIRDTDIAEEMMAYTKNNIFNLRKEDKINQRVKKPVFMRLCGEVALGCEECLAA